MTATLPTSRFEQRAVGDVVEWDAPTHPLRRGVVLERGDEAGSADVDALMGRPAGTGWREFGALLSVRCTDRACSCQLDSEWRDGKWLHAVNECQVRTPVDDVEVAALVTDYVKVEIVVDRETLDRYVYAAEQRSEPGRTVNPLRLIAATLRDDASFLPPRPRPTGRRTKQELREESRARRGGVGAHTEAIETIQGARGSTP